MDLLRFFSFEQLKVLQYPLITTLEYIELPFINRVENLVYTFFLFSNLMSAVMFGFAALMALGRIFPRPKGKVLELVVTCVMFAAAWFPQIIRQSERLLREAYYIEMVLAYCIPLLLIPFAWRYHRTRGGSA